MPADALLITLAPTGAETSKDVCELHQLSQDRQVVPEFELFDLGHIAALNRLLDRYGLPYGGRVHVDFVMGVPGGMPGTADALVAGVAMLPNGGR